MDPWQLGLLLWALAATAVLVAAVLYFASVRRSVTREARAREAETVRWLSGQLTEVMDRFHRQLGEFGHQMREGQGAAGQAVARQMLGLSNAVTSQLDASHKTLGEGLTRATEVFGAVSSQLGEVAENAARMEKLARGIEELEGILKVPKLRGLLAEKTLEEMLRQVLPGQFWEAQHRFSDGRTVDAVIRLSGRMVPVDAKFPLEAWRRMAEAGDEASELAARREFARAVKGRIDEIADRYIRPGEGTFDFGLMYVPAEAVYAEVVAPGGPGAADLLDYGLSRRVLPVSPSTLYAYLSTVVSGLRGLEVDKRAAEILRSIEGLEVELGRLKEELAVLGRHLQNASAKFSDAERRVARLEAQLGALGREGAEEEGS